MKCGTFSCRISTISPSTRFRWGFCHLLLSCITTRYSFFHPDQNKFAKCCTLRHRRRIYTSFCWNFPNGGNITVDLVVKMWLGVSGSRSPGSPATVVKGLELIIASTSHMSVRNDSSSKQWPYSSIKPEELSLWSWSGAPIRHPSGWRRVDWRSTSRCFLSVIWLESLRDPFLLWLGATRSLHRRNSCHCHSSLLWQDHGRLWSAGVLE